MPRPKKILKVLNFTVLVLLFLVCGFIVIAYATGYKIDLKSRNFIQTSIIDVQTNSSDGQIFINNELKGTGRVTLRNVEEGTYQVKILRDGYFDWSRKFDLQPGEAAVLNDVILFRKNPIIATTSVDVTKDQLSKLADQDGLYVSGGEIYQNNNLITRYSQDIKGASWYADQHYVSFTLNKKLIIIEIDGSNQIELLDKDSDTPAIFVNSGRSVIYENGGKIVQAEIR